MIQGGFPGGASQEFDQYDKGILALRVTKIELVLW